MTDLIRVLLVETDGNVTEAHITPSLRGLEAEVGGLAESLRLQDSLGGIEMWFAQDGDHLHENELASGLQFDSYREFCVVNGTVVLASASEDGPVSLTQTQVDAVHKEICPNARLGDDGRPRFCVLTAPHTEHRDSNGWAFRSVSAS